MASFNVRSRSKDKDDPNYLTPKQKEYLKGAAPLLLNEEKSQEILRYIMDRVKLSRSLWTERANAFQKTDNQLYAQPMPTADKAKSEDEAEFKRLQDLESGQDVKTVNRNFGFANSKLERSMAFFMKLFAPNDQIYTASADATKIEAANALALELERGAAHARHYSAFYKFLQSTLRYNFAAMSCFWEQHRGRVLTASVDQGTVNSEIGISWQGNVLIPHNPYNFFYDISVELENLPTDGEYYGWVEPITPFAAKRAEIDGRMFWTKRFLFSNGQAPGAANGVTSYYIRPELPRGVDRDKDEWSTFLSGGRSPGNGADDSTPYLELLHFVGWIDPRMLDPVYAYDAEKPEYQLWRFDVINGAYLANAVQINDVHGMLPVVTSPADPDCAERRLPSKADRLIPFSQFGSFELNVRQQAARKALGGITLYDRAAIPFARMPAGDMIGAKIPVNLRQGQRIADTFYQITDVPQNGDQVASFQMVDNFMEQVSPTDYIKQMSDLERATRYQAAAVSNGMNQQNLVTARIIYTNAFAPLAKMEAWNYMVNTATVTVNSGNGPQQVSTADLLAANVEVDIGTGLRGIDRMILVEDYLQLISYINQNQQAIQRFDMVKLLNYVSTLMGDKTDLSQFELPPQQQQQQAQMANKQAAQQSTGGTKNGR